MQYCLLLSGTKPQIQCTGPFNDACHENVCETVVPQQLWHLWSRSLHSAVFLYAQENEKPSAQLTGQWRRLKCCCAPGATSAFRRVWPKTFATAMSSNTSQPAWAKWVSLGVHTSVGFGSKLWRLTMLEPNYRGASTARSLALLNTLQTWMLCWAGGHREGKGHPILFHQIGWQSVTLTPLTGQEVSHQIWIQAQRLVDTILVLLGRQGNNVCAL